MFLELLILSPVYILLPPIFFIISITLFLAVIGQSLGVRRLYIDFLLKVFEVLLAAKKIKTGRLSNNCFRSMRTIPKRRKTTRGTTASLLGGKSLIQTLRKKKVTSNLMLFLFQLKSFNGHYESGNAYSAVPNAHGYTRKYILSLAPPLHSQK